MNLFTMWSFDSMISRGAARACAPVAVTGIRREGAETETEAEARLEMDVGAEAEVDIKMEVDVNAAAWLEYRIEEGSIKKIRSKAAQATLQSNDR
ncbi:MAG: hypothetical protein H5T33_08230 [Candidatus Methanosuratus sp.]|nr:hypothetical protein [Candidatus Methanosuratincola sp.]